MVSTEFASYFITSTQTSIQTQIVLLVLRKAQMRVGGYVTKYLTQQWF